MRKNHVSKSNFFKIYKDCIQFSNVNIDELTVVFAINEMPSYAVYMKCSNLRLAKVASVKFIYDLLLNTYTVYRIRQGVWPKVQQYSIRFKLSRLYTNLPSTF